MRRHAVLALLGIAVLALLVGSHAAEEAKKKSGKAKTENFIHKGDPWIVNRAENGRPFYYNVKTGKTTWDDPRRELSANQRLMVVALFLSPFALIILAGGAYIYYMKVYHPDRLKGPKKGKKAGKRSPLVTPSSPKAPAATPAVAGDAAKKDT